MIYQSMLNMGWEHVKAFFVLLWTLSSFAVLVYPKYSQGTILIITTAVSAVSIPVSGEFSRCILQSLQGLANNARVKFFLFSFLHTRDLYA